MFISRRQLIRALKSCVVRLRTCRIAYWAEPALVRRGIAVYKDHLDTNPTALLRRNCHRIEKGLLMRPRRTIFAVDYVGETITAYKKRSQTGPTTGNAEWAWFTDVLGAFFDLGGGEKSTEIRLAQAQFESVAPTERTGRTPYPSGDLSPTAVSAADFDALARRRKSVRWFLDKPIPRKLIDASIRSAVNAPSACNRQAYRYLVIDKPELLLAVARTAMGLEGYAHQLPCLIAVIGDWSAFFHRRDRHLPYIDASLSTMGLLLAAETHGLATCVVNWPDIAERDVAIRKLLGLPRHEQVVILVALGYPDPAGHVAYSQRKNLDSLRSYA